MKLKEFDFDYPYEKNEDYIQSLLDNGYEYLQATKKDYEENHKAKRINFRMQTRCITAFVERLLKKVNTPDFWKILINCGSNVDKRESKVVGGVYGIYYELNVEKFMQLSDIEKKRVTLQILKENVIKIFENLQIDSGDFEKVCEQIQRCKYRNEWVWGKKKNKKLTAEGVLVHNIKSAQIFLRIYRDNERIGVFEILTTKPDEFCFSKYLGKIKWIDDETIAIEQKNGAEYLLIDINEGITNTREENNFDQRRT